MLNSDNNEIGHPCRSRSGAEVNCNETVACTVTIAGKDADLHFCECPERPQRPQRPAGGNRQNPAGGNAQSASRRQRCDN